MLVWLAAMAVGIVLILRAPFSADLSAFLPQSPDARQQLLIDQLQSGPAARTLLIGIDGGSAAERADASRGLSRAMRTSGLFDQVQNGDTTDWEAAGRWLVDHRYQLSPAVTPERFTVAGLADAIGDTLSQLGTPAGNALRPLLERDPTGETQRIAEALLPRDAPRSEEGVWVSRTAPRALLLAGTRAAGADLDAQAAALAQVRSAFAALDRPQLTLQVSGPPVFAVESRDRIKREAIQLAAVGAAVMGGLLLLAFASPRALLLAALPVATGVVVGTAAVALAFGTVHGLTLGFGSTLIGETVDYAIYYLIQARGVAAPGTGWRDWRTRHWPTVRLGVLTSVVGFAALVFSGFPGLAQLGVFSLAGLAAAALATRYLLPVLAPDGAPGRGLRRQLARVAAALVRSLPRLRPLVAIVGVAAAAVVAWQGARLWQSDLGAMSPVPRSAQALDAALRADIGASDARTLVVAQGADVQSVLRTAEAAGPRLDRLIEEGVLTGYDTVTHILPSLAAQQARQAALPTAEALRQRVAEALQGQPLRPDRLEPFIVDIEAARSAALLDERRAAEGPLGPLVRALLVERLGGGWTTIIALHPGARYDDTALRQALDGLPGLQVVDVKHELDSLYERYLHEAVVQVLLGALAVAVLLGVYLRSLRRLAAVCLPLALAVLLVLGGLALGHAFAGWPALGILHLVGLLLVVAVGSNYALFFDQLRQSGGADEDTLASLLLANLTTVVSFGLIALSHIPALSAIGQVVAPGALLALLLSATFSAQREVRRHG
ncbi:MMPL family transporter [uncultured Xylophilus sp.]|uniref:MMPL family transporter n=1 Tax=uncultured Xylophilus sp. TaxID=296832 RepID=UPI0025D401F5|nr:MMPL family transporter [uncultured Xylophilus sp.]